MLVVLAYHRIKRAIDGYTILQVLAVISQLYTTYDYATAQLCDVKLTHAAVQPE
jgi:hypothetical protein